MTFEQWIQTGHMLQQCNIEFGYAHSLVNCGFRIVDKNMFYTQKDFGKVLDYIRSCNLVNMTPQVIDLTAFCKMSYDIRYCIGE